MKQISLSIIVYCSLTGYAFGQNPFWVHLDKKIIRELNAVDRGDARNVEAYFIEHRKRPATKENLGFGWSISNMAVGGGYTSISGTFVYFNDTIVSYSLYSRVPDENKLIRRYTGWLKGTFAIDSSGIKSLDYRKHLLSIPLIGYDGPLKIEDLPVEVFNYMSLHSGTMYGYSGGLNNTLFQNRSNFNKLKQKLTTDIVYLLMYSVNPASRLTAIEYYRKNSQEFDNKDKIDTWIDTVYKEVPMVHTLMGCIGETWNSRLLVEFCSKIEE
ncbi:hypothetical protein [Chryseolinea sp. H1M3-3]|uniref:hypothetical protein n=1 Tax=Chryseolinea sp. H1M3-3 TaxID=3034144 RepID=UPI0023ECD557|nr:hypothetical protein [Chryseolinea sp. H1M3-3]